MFRDEAKLISYTETKDADGYPIKTPTTSDVFVNVKSAKRSEFYAALQVGKTITKVFEIRVCDYADQGVIEHDGKKYNIVRSYTKDGEMLELNCSDLAV